jgi:Ca-activated chloride channel family protein
MDKPDRLGLIKKSLRMLVERLGPLDLVAIVQYDSHARLILEHTPAARRDRILKAIDALQCGGSTNLEEGMRLAYRVAAARFAAGGENRVLLLSDGVANLGSVSAEDILKVVEGHRRQGIFLSVFGFGTGTYDDAMLETLANKGDGVYAFLDSDEEARRVFVEDLAATLNTIARDVKIQVEFNPKRTLRYRQIGYENRQLRKEDFRDDAVDAGEVGSGQSVTALYELEMAPSPRQRAAVAADEDGPIAVVRIRYRPAAGSGAAREIERPVTDADASRQFESAPAWFRLAACVAEFAEILRGSPFARGVEFQEVAAELRPVALDRRLDGRLGELLRVVESAGGMTR